MPDDPAVLLWLHREDAPALPPSSTVLDVRTVALPPASADDGRVAFRADLAAAAEAARGHIGHLWFVGGDGAEAPLLAGIVEDVMAGRAAVFGFAGIIVRDAVAPMPSTGVPALALAASGPEALDAFAAWAGGAPAVPPTWARLIASDRVDPAVRGVLARRALADDPAYAPQTVDAAQLALLRELADVLVPQDGAAIDLAARVDAQYAHGEGDGWRFAELPPDAEALRRGLATLHPLWPAADEDRERLITTVVEGGAETDGPFDADELAAWLEDLRVDLVRQWLAHPASMAAVGYDGFATGGTVIPLRGFDAPASRREPWEPADVAAEVVA